MHNKYDNYSNVYINGECQDCKNQDHVFSRLKVSDYDTWNYDKNFVYWK